MPPGFTPPPKWDDDDLRAARDRSEALFKEERSDEGPKAFAQVCAEIDPVVRNALAVTDDLRALTGDVMRHDPELFQTLRNFCGPPISEEDLWTLVGGPKFKRVPDDYADDTAEVIGLVIDPVRFPWIEKQRPPTKAERDAAVLATTVLMAVRRVGTDRRGTASVRQEAAVGAVLTTAGYSLDSSREPIHVLDSLARRTFSHERKLAGAKCDVPVRLRDGRILAIECKVSNGPKNSWKRVNREIGGKAETWRHHFGTQVITAAVLSGVYDFSCVASAQNNQSVTIFWEHDLAPLGGFVRAS